MAAVAESGKEQLDALFGSDDDDDDDVVGVSKTVAPEAASAAAVDQLFGDSDVDDSGEDEAPKVRLKLKARGGKVRQAPHAL